MKTLIFNIIFFFSFFGLMAQTPQDFFQQGNEFYKKGKYQEAVKLYEKALNKKEESSELYFNLANAYYKLNKIAPSIYFYEKAKKLNPEDEDIQYNLQLANRMKMDKIEVLPIGFSRRIGQSISQIFNYNTWAILAIIWSFIGLLTFLVFLFSKNSNYKRLGFAGMFLFLFLLLFSLYFTEISKKISQEKFAIVFVPKTELMTEPNLTSDKLVDLHEGTKVQVIKNDEDWSLIKLPDGKKAWVPKTDIKLIN